MHLAITFNFISGFTEKRISALESFLELAVAFLQEFWPGLPVEPGLTNPTPQLAEEWAGGLQGTTALCLLPAQLSLQGATATHSRKLAVGV